MHILGIDIGGSGIKGAPVDTKQASFLQAFASRRQKKANLNPLQK
jgi:sugar (pentulose or hexulose) kinase